MPEENKCIRCRSRKRLAPLNAEGKVAVRCETCGETGANSDTPLEAVKSWNEQNPDY